MKTPEGIKKGLECCGKTNCDGCPYDFDCETPYEACARDALAYIRQLEAGIDHAEKVARECAKSITENLDKLQAKLIQVERERDAAVTDLSDSCQKCKFVRKTFNVSPCEDCFQRDGKYPWSPMVRTKFEWRGVCEENTKEE